MILIRACFFFSASCRKLCNLPRKPIALRSQITDSTPAYCDLGMRVVLENLGFCLTCTRIICTHTHLYKCVCI